MPLQNNYVTNKTQLQILVYIQVLKGNKNKVKYFVHDFTVFIFLIMVPEKQHISYYTNWPNAKRGGVLHNHSAPMHRQRNLGTVFVSFHLHVEGKF